MQYQQHTIQRMIHFEGIGLHTGKKVKGKLIPMPINTGIQFQRIDLPDQPFIEASEAYVTKKERSTLLRKNKAQVDTVEHLLAAIVGIQVDNICIQLDGPEVPDLDGSSLAFVHFLLEAGIMQQEAPRNFFTIKEKFMYHNPDTGSHYTLYPDSECSIHVTLLYDRLPIGYQYANLSTLADFKETIASARTFTFLDEISSLYKKGLLQGADPKKSIIFSDYQNNKKLLSEVTQLTGYKIENLVTPKNLSFLHYGNEPARHKLLDLIGDLALLSRPLQGKIFAHKPGHSSNIGLITALKKYLMKHKKKIFPVCNLEAKPRFDVKQISRILPHRYPFQLVDKIIDLSSSYIIGVKNVTINEPFFQGHFPSSPIMPGVLQVEALAQTSGILALHNVPDPEQYVTYFLSIDRCKFRRMIVPGDTLVLYCALLSSIKYSTTKNKSVVGIAKVKGSIFISEYLACEAVLLAKMVKQPTT